MNISRRSLTAAFLSAPVVGLNLGNRAQAQSTLTEEQQKSFAGIYAANGPTPATLSELARTLQFQEKLSQSPTNMDDISAHIAQTPLMQAVANGVLPALGKLYAWHQLSLDASALDHTTSSTTNPPPTFAEQLGPARTSRALAIVHIAMFEAVNAITRRAQSYDNIQLDIFKEIAAKPDNVTPDTASIDMAIMESAYNSLVAVYPKKEPMFKATYELLYVSIPDTPCKNIRREGRQSRRKCHNLTANWKGSRRSR
jgi:hypothetical protein